MPLLMVVTGSPVASCIVRVSRSLKAAPRKKLSEVPISATASAPSFFSSTASGTTRSMTVSKLPIDTEPMASPRPRNEMPLGNSASASAGTCPDAGGTIMPMVRCFMCGRLSRVLSRLTLPWLSAPVQPRSSAGSWPGSRP